MRTPFIDLFRPSVHAICRAYFGLDLRGVEHVPQTGPVIIAPNHQTYADPILVTIPVRRPVYYMAWNRFFAIPGLAWAIRRLRAFPVDLDSRDWRATRAMIRLLKAGEAVMIFPEGERSHDGDVAPFKSGAFRLAASLAVPVLPVTITGGHDSWPPDRMVPRPGRITITYHALVRGDAHANPRESARVIGERTRTAILSAMPAQPRSSTR